MSDGRIIIDTEIDSSGAEKGVGKLGGIAKGAAGALGGIAKGAMVGIGAATVAVGGLVKASIDQFAQYEQLVGGVETLFKDSSGIVSEYADNAYKTAGMSANEYMSTITGFSASLLQGLGGDTAKAAEVGNKAVTDMSDNANKMGTSMESVQNAYQGFAKNNYTMLDNLKLGYGGTKTEMERLLVDAGKLSGMEYDIGNFSDVIEAIHVVQDEMGITGTTAKEASSTIEGSLSMTKSAWSNLLTGMAFDDADFDTLINNLVDSVSALGENLLPRVETILGGISEVISRLLPPIAEKIPELLMQILPKLIEAGTNIISALVNGIQTNMDSITSGAMTIITSLITGLMTALPQIISITVELIKSLLMGIQANLPMLVTGALQILTALVQGIITLLPMLITIGLQLIIALAMGLAQQLPTLIPQIVQGILDCVMAILDNIDLFIDAAIQLIFGLMEGLMNALPMLIEQMPMIVEKLVTAIVNNLPKIIEAGIQLIIMLAFGLVKAIPQLVKAIPQIIGAIVDGLGSLNSKMSDVGLNLIKGLWEGISNAKDWLFDKIGGFADGVVDGFKNFFDINSPSRIMRDLIGTNLVKGIGIGVELETPSLEKDINGNMSDLVAKMQGTVDFETAKTTAGVVAGRNAITGVDTIGDNETSNASNKTTIEIPVIIDGKEFMRATAPYQTVYEEYNIGRG